MSAEAQPTLAVALSARALATAARRAGALVVALDLFADEDTAAIATRALKIRGRSFAFDREALLEAVEEQRGKVAGLVYGAGLEHDPALLAMLGSCTPILGNGAEAVAKAKDPAGFAALLERIGAPYPEIALEAPADGDWLAKKIGGSGGGHIAPATAGSADVGVYFQRRVDGRAVSALFLGDGRSARVLGYSEQWTSATTDMPFRYGGCVGPVRLGAKAAAAIDELCAALTGALGLVGLNSLDLLLDGDHFHVLEINPRPGATLDILDGRDGTALWRAHVEAVAGRLASVGKLTGAPRAAAIVYAPARLGIPLAFTGPDWSADRSRAGAIIESGAPVCTVMATAATPAEAREAVERRARRLLAGLERLPRVRPERSRPWLTSLPRASTR